MTLPHLAGCYPTREMAETIAIRLRSHQLPADIVPLDHVPRYPGITNTDGRPLTHNGPCYLVKTDYMANFKLPSPQPEWLSQALNEGDGVYRP